MGASEFFGAYFPVLFLLICAALLSFSLQCIVGAVALVVSITDEIAAGDARSETTGAEISGAPTVKGSPNPASRIHEPTIRHGDPGGDTWPPPIAARSAPRGCVACAKARAAVFRLLGRAASSDRLFGPDV